MEPVEAVMKTTDAEAVIVGSGPGGATVARELSLGGKKVVLLEKGKRHPITSRLINSCQMYDKFGVFSRSEEGVIIGRTITVGGCSVVFSGKSFNPPGWLQEEMGLDLEATADEIRGEIGIKPLSEEFTRPWVGTKRLREVA